MSTVPVEIHTDIIGKKLYASRNYNQLRHVYQSGTCNRTQVDWGLTLRQVPGPKPKLKTSASAPTLHTSELAQSRTKREPLAPEHPEGPYQGGSQSLGKYQNFANSAHMCNGLVRVSSGAAPKVDWQLNLRNGMHQNEFNTKWNRHYARPNPLPFEYVPEPISFRRWPGCEGTQAKYWRHLIEVRNWTCEACHAVGFSLAPGSMRLVRQAELGEADSTFIFAARLRYLDGQPRLWPSARASEPLRRKQQDCWGHCGSRGGYCDWCGVGNACCRQGEAGDPAECFNASGFSGAEQHECVQVQSPVPKVPVQHEHEDCWIYCGKAGGFCDWCGGGNACCKFGYDADPVECRGAANASAHRDHHVCTAVAPMVPPANAEDFGCVLSIRGSKTFTNALHDAFFWSDELPHEDCEGCQVFDGFWRVWSGIESKVERVLIDNGCIPGTPQGTILITGHSLGAAVATLAMYMLQLRGYSVGLPTILHRRGLGTMPFTMFLPKSSIEASLCTASPVRAILWCMCRHFPSIITWVPKRTSMATHRTLWWCVWAQRTRNAQIAIPFSRRSFLAMTIASRSWPLRRSLALAFANASSRTKSEKCHQLDSMLKHALICGSPEMQ